MFNGRIQGLGPRYCPSIEDKINRFAERERHQIFVEPEGWNTYEIYVNGFSTSLPDEVQFKAIRLIPGFESAKIFRPGYAIEYDYFPPTQLNLTLETQQISNLYFAGQINGTTGYEEAACQGLMAGINAHLKINEIEPLVLGRSEAYIGVLIDDLVNKGTDEPYRMFTSRAEYRLMLRQDNADIRLTEKSNKLGLASKERMQAVEQKIKETDSIIRYFQKQSITPAEANPCLEKLETSEGFYYCHYHLSMFCLCVHVCAYLRLRTYIQQTHTHTNNQKPAAERQTQHDNKNKNPEPQEPREKAIKQQ
jgi:tRNA uridine 5-carboxymethylaminomethyl modification enzyme